MKLTIILFALAVMCCGCGNGTSTPDEQANYNSQNRYAEEDVTADHGVMVLKSDMNPISGIVFSEFGDNGKCVNGKRDGS